MSDLGDMLMDAVPKREGQQEKVKSNPSSEEQEYFELLERALKGAEYLERKDLTKEQRRRGERLYDALTEKVLELRQRLDGEHRR